MISSTPPFNHEHGYILYTFINEVGVDHLVEKVTFNRSIQYLVSQLLTKPLHKTKIITKTKLI